MNNNINIRIEKKTPARLKLVDIRSGRIQHYLRKFLRDLNGEMYTDIICIGVKHNGGARCYSSMTQADSVLFLSTIKNKYLEAE